MPDEPQQKPPRRFGLGWLLDLFALPENATPEIVIARARRLWTLAMCDLVLYAGIAWLFHHFWFEPKTRNGVFDVTSSRASTIFLVVALLAIVLGQATTTIKRAGRHRSLAEASSDNREFAQVFLFAHALGLIMIGEATALLGLTVFIATANVRALVFLLLAAAVFHLQSFPSRSWIPEDLRRNR